MNIIPVFLPHAGCKVRCTFCNEYAATGIHKSVDRNGLILEVNRYREYFRDKENVDIAFYGGTFTGLPVELIEFYLEISRELIENRLIKGIRFSTSPDEITPEKLSLISNYPVSLIELGVQSFNETVLSKAGRPHRVKEVFTAIDLIRDERIPFGIHLMTGLPGDTVEYDIFSAMKTAELGATSARIHPTVVLKGSLLEKMFLEGKYKPQSLDEALDILWRMYVILYDRKIIVSRVGICLYGEEVKSVTAGPYHDALGDLVKSRVALEIVCSIKERLGIGNVVPIPVSMKQYFTGYKRYVIEKASLRGVEIRFVDNATLDFDFEMGILSKLVSGGCRI